MSCLRLAVSLAAASALVVLLAPLSVAQPLPGAVPPRVAGLTAERITVAGALPLRRFDTFVLRSPVHNEDCGLLVLDTVAQQPGGWIGIGAHRPGTRARLGDPALLVGEGNVPGSPACSSRSEPPPRPPAPAPAWTGLHRGFLRVRPYLGFHRIGWGAHAEPTSGVIADLGAEANTASGFKIGFEIAPLKYVYERPQMTGRLHLGYANEVFAVSLGIANGLSWYYPQLGPIVRLGRFDRSFALLRISWSVYPPRPIPMDLDIDVYVRVSPRIRWNLNLGGGYGNVIGVYATTGAQLLIGGVGLRGTTALSAGLGVAWVVFDLGPAFSLGIEHRF